MLTKLRYVGACTDDLLEIYCLFIISTAEYWSAVFASSLTIEQAKKLTNIGRTSFKPILEYMYISYEAGLEMFGLTSLSERQSAHLLRLAQVAAQHSVAIEPPLPGCPWPPDNGEIQGQLCEGSCILLQHYSHSLETPYGAAQHPKYSLQYHKCREIYAWFIYAFHQ